MSIQLMRRVWELNLSHLELLILLALTDHADDNGQKCFPSVARLAWKTGYSPRTVQRTLRDLEQREVIKPVRHKKGGRGLSTEYLIQIEKGVKKSPFQSEKGCHPGRKRVTSEAGKADKAMSPQPPLTINYPSKEPEAAFKEKFGQTITRIYNADPIRFEKLLVWVKTALNNGWSKPVILEALERFEERDKRGSVENWWPYLTVLVQKLRTERLERESEKYKKGDLSSVGSILKRLGLREIQEEAKRQGIGTNE